MHFFLLDCYLNLCACYRIGSGVGSAVSSVAGLASNDVSFHAG